MTTLFDFSAVTIEGKSLALSSCRGRLSLIVNTASRCRFTPQLAELELLHRSYGERGLTILGFPCDQFLGQELDVDADVNQFCVRNFGVSFQLMQRIKVNGAETAPLFVWLKAQCPGVMGSKAIKWNFTKFLVDPDGKPIGRYAPTTRPSELSAEIERRLPLPA